MKDCPVKYALDVLSGKWTMYILYILTEQETIRFNELQRQVGSISALMLSRTLCELEKNGLVLRREFNAIPPHAIRPIIWTSAFSAHAICFIRRKSRGDRRTGFASFELSFRV